MEVKVDISGGGALPLKHSAGASGFDLRTIEKQTLAPGETRIFKSGIRMAIPIGYEGQIRSRSGMASRGIVVVGGTIDSDYRGDIGIILHNQSGKPVVIESGQRVAQIVFAPVPTVRITVGELDGTERGEKGFGSTGELCT